MALTVLGLAAEGTTTVEEAWQIDRGYSDVPGKLRHLGAAVSRAGMRS
jgi:UDP-N-acetylglucosamine enolpyruvyl transferase